MLRQTLLSVFRLFIGCGIAISLIFTSSIFGQDSTGTVTDIDGNVYKTVKIGDQWWMAENLRVRHYKNGVPIPNVMSAAQWSGFNVFIDGFYCAYDNDEELVPTYGRLFNWFTIKNEYGLAPNSWHVPTDQEWKELELAHSISYFKIID